MHQEYDLAALYSIHERVRSPSTTAVDQWMNLVVIDYMNGNVGIYSQVYKYHSMQVYVAEPDTTGKGKRNIRPITDIGQMGALSVATTNDG